MKTLIVTFKRLGSGRPFKAVLVAPDDTRPGNNQDWASRYIRGKFGDNAIQVTSVLEVPQTQGFFNVVA